MRADAGEPDFSWGPRQADFLREAAERPDPSVALTHWIAETIMEPRARYSGRPCGRFRDRPFRRRYSSMIVRITNSQLQAALATAGTMGMLALIGSGIALLQFWSWLVAPCRTERPKRSQK